MSKRIALVLALVGAFAFASIAWGATGFAGRFETGGTVAFNLAEPEPGGLKQVRRWRWDNLRIKCRNGKHRYDGMFTGLRIPVDPKFRTFRKKALNTWGGRAVLRGEFNEDYTSATGTFKIRGRTSVGRRCRTNGKVPWTARGAEPAPE